MIYRKDRGAIYYDAEFTGLHRNTTLVSIGLVSQSGAYFYAEFNDYDQSQVDDWLQENVIAKLLYGTFQAVDQRTINGINSDGMMSRNIRCKGSKEAVGDVLRGWLLDEFNHLGRQLMFYTDCYAYDWVLLNDLICAEGKALNLPKFIDYIPIDLSTALQIAGIDPDVTRENFVGGRVARELEWTEPFKSWGSKLKHNCLWDAYICKYCFDKLGSNTVITDNSGQLL